MVAPFLSSQLTVSITFTSIMTVGIDFDQMNKNAFCCAHGASMNRNVKLRTRPEESRTCD